MWMCSIGLFWMIDVIVNLPTNQLHLQPNNVEIARFVISLVIHLPIIIRLA